MVQEVVVVPEKEEISEQLINDIEVYLNDVIMQKEKIIDISETTIGNFGAKFVAEAVPECDGLEEIRLSNCGIKDDGALAIFEKLRTSQSATMLDLNRNQLTEKCFDGLIQMLQVNKSIVRVELRGLSVKNKFSIHKIKPYNNRVVM